MPAAAPYEITVSVEAPKDAKEAKEFAEAAHAFVESLKGINGLEVEVPAQAAPGSRGFIAILTAIAVWGSKVVSFKAIYTVAKDLLDKFHNAEVVLKFPDGSTLKLKGLSRAEAESLIEKHLRQPTPP
jgi:hypothetical protein